MWSRKCIQNTWITAHNISVCHPHSSAYPNDVFHHSVVECMGASNIIRAIFIVKSSVDFMWISIIYDKSEYFMCIFGDGNGLFRNTFHILRWAIFSTCIDNWMNKASHISGCYNLCKFEAVYTFFAPVKLRHFRPGSRKSRCLQFSCAP